MRAMTFTDWLPYTPPTLSLPRRGSERKVTDVLETAIMGSMVGIIVGVRVGSGVNVKVGSMVLVGSEVAEVCGVSVVVNVEAVGTRPGEAHPYTVKRTMNAIENRNRFNEGS